MPIYEFISEDGQWHEEFFPMGEAPSIGEAIERCDVRFVRVVSRVAVPTMFDSKNMNEAEIQLAMEHKADIESRPDELEWKEKGPQEFRPNIARTLY